jgi:hypothetical protein
MRHDDEDDWTRKVQVTGEAEQECVERAVGATTLWIAREAANGANGERSALAVGATTLWIAREAANGE